MAEPPERFELADPEQTAAAGRILGSLLKPGRVVALLGDLGAGKTALAKSAVAAQGEVEPDDVVSPTFMIAAEYPGRVEVLHLDAYRLSGPGSLDELDLGIGERPRAVLIEWAERVEGALPQDRLELELEHAPAGRVLSVRGLGEARAWALELRRALAAGLASAELNSGGGGQDPL